MTQTKTIAGERTQEIVGKHRDGTTCYHADRCVLVERTQSLNERINALNAADAAFFADAFTDPVTKQPYGVPVNLKKLSARLCRSYGITGVCDPMYIANVIAVELGLGDGLSNFYGEGRAQ